MLSSSCSPNSCAPREERETRKKIDHLHAHFAHDPTLIAYLAHCITGIPYTFTAHARDLYQIPEQF